MKLILISGKAQHGKDSVARMLQATLIRRGRLVAISHYGDAVKFLADLFLDLGLPIDMFNGEKTLEQRQILQDFGTELMRKRHPDYWIKHMELQLVALKELEYEYVIISDVRMYNEILEMMARYNVITVRVERLEYTSKLSPEQQEHISETALDDHIFDYTIRAKNGLINLIDQVEFFADKISGGKNG